MINIAIIGYGNVAHAAFRLKTAGHKGAFTMPDIPPALYSPHTPDALRSQYT